MPRTRIVVTLGPATDRPGVLRDVLLAGADVVRLNAAHGTHDEHRRRIEQVRALSRDVDRPVAVLLDLQGPKVRVGELPPSGIDLREGDECLLATSPGGAARATGTVIPVDYEPLAREVQAGQLILLDDGNLALRAVQTDGSVVRCRVERGGRLTAHKGMNLPGVALSAPALTEKDLDDVAFGVAEGVDFFGLSFVRRAADVAALRQHAGGTAIIAKIERPEALAEIGAILDAADGLMVARGDLGVELPLEQVPAIQRQLLQAANRAGKPAITATQMLESMVRQPRPTRAEATDVHVAVLQRTDAVMLSAETAIGAYPVEAVRAICAIAAAAETQPELAIPSQPRSEVARDATEAVAQAACEMAAELGAKAIVTSTTSGTTPRMVAKYRPAVPILALAHDPRVRRRLMLTWGVTPLAAPRFGSTDEMLAAANRLVVETGLAAAGDLVVITAGVGLGAPGHTNLIKVHRVGEPTATGM
jgi:pyruvate kinase